MNSRIYFFAFFVNSTLICGCLYKKNMTEIYYKVENSYHNSSNVSFSYDSMHIYKNKNIVNYRKYYTYFCQNKFGEEYYENSQNWLITPKHLLVIRDRILTGEGPTWEMLPLNVNDTISTSQYTNFGNKSLVNSHIHRLGIDTIVEVNGLKIPGFIYSETSVDYINGLRIQDESYIIVDKRTLLPLYVLMERRNNKENSVDTIEIKVTKIKKI